MGMSVVKMVLLPRFTAFQGAAAGTDFFTPPLNIRDFAKVLLTVWKSHGLGATEAAINFMLQQSTDLGIWEDVGSSFTPSAAESETTVSRDMALEWMRLKITVATSGASAGITTWAIGAFVPRDKGPSA